VNLQKTCRYFQPTAASAGQLHTRLSIAEKADGTAGYIFAPTQERNHDSARPWGMACPFHVNNVCIPPDYM
jgi:hypothetical protein